MRQAIAFDLDGTLIDISKRDYQIYVDLVIKLGGIPLPFLTYWPLRQAKTDIHQILSDSGILRLDLVETFLLDRKALMETLEYLSVDNLFQDVLQLLNRISDTYEVHILTIRHNKTNTENQLKLLGLDRYTCHIVDGNKELTMRQIPNLCFMVGDTENDILPANKIGIKSIGVTTGIRNRQLLVKMNPTYIVDSLDEINRFL